MKFIIIVVGVVLLHYMSALSALQKDSWYRAWIKCLAGFQWLQNKCDLRLLLAVLMPVCLLVVVLVALGYRWYGLPVFGISFIVFLYALGRGDFNQQMKDYSEVLQRDDLTEANRWIANFGGSTLPSKTVTSWAAHQQQAVSAVGYSYFERYFIVIFWFVLAGAPGALLYRLLALHSDLAPEIDQQDSSRTLHALHLMEWLPLRLLGFSLAFMGNFTSCMEEWMSTFFDDRSACPHQVILHYIVAAKSLKHEQAESALQVQQTILGVVDLFHRTLIFALCVAAFIVIFV